MLTRKMAVFTFLSNALLICAVALSDSTTKLERRLNYNHAKVITACVLGCMDLVARDAIAEEETCVRQCVNQKRREAGLRPLSPVLVIEQR